MSISVTCQCGKKYSVSDDKAGKRIRCRACNEIIEVPDDRWGDDDEVYEEDAAGEPHRAHLPSHARADLSHGLG